MPRNGTGLYVLPAGQPVVAGTVISDSVFNVLTSDIADTLTASIAADGQKAMTGNLPLGGNKITNLGAGIAPSDAVRYDQVAQATQAQTYTAFTTGGTATAYTLTPTPAITAYAGGQAFQVGFHTASGATPTLQISGVATPPNLVRRIGDGTLANIAAGDIPAGSFRVVGLSATQYEVTGLAAAVVSAPGNSALSGNRNRIINAACDIAQRPPLVCSVGVSGYGGPDRYYTTNDGAGGQFTQTLSGMAFNGIARNTVRQTVNTGTTSFAAGNFWFGITQKIEGFNAYDLRGKPVAISFVFNANLTGTYSVSLRDSTASQSYVTTFAAVANTPLQVKILIPTIPLASSIPLTNGLGLFVVVGFQNQGTFQTSTLNAWQAGNFLSANTAIIWAATAGNFIELTDLQLEEGAAVTPTERRSYSVEFALCSRYYQKKTHNVTPSNALSTVHFMTSMRAAPTNTVTFDVGTGATFTVMPFGDLTNALYQSAVHSTQATASILLSAEL